MSEPERPLVGSAAAATLDRGDHFGGSSKSLERIGAGLALGRVRYAGAVTEHLPTCVDAGAATIAVVLGDAVPQVVRTHVSLWAVGVLGARDFRVKRDVQLVDASGEEHDENPQRE